MAAIPRLKPCCQNLVFSLRQPYFTLAGFLLKQIVLVLWQRWLHRSPRFVLCQFINPSWTKKASSLIIPVDCLGMTPIGPIGVTCPFLSQSRARRKKCVDWPGLGHMPTLGSSSQSQPTCTIMLGHSKGVIVQRKHRACYTRTGK